MAIVPGLWLIGSAEYPEDGTTLMEAISAKAAEAEFRAICGLEADEELSVSPLTMEIAARRLAHAENEARAEQDAKSRPSAK